MDDSVEYLQRIVVHSVHRIVLLHDGDDGNSRVRGDLPGDTGGVVALYSYNYHLMRCLRLFNEHNRVDLPRAVEFRRADR